MLRGRYDTVKPEIQVTHRVRNVMLEMQARSTKENKSRAVYMRLQLVNVSQTRQRVDGDWWHNQDKVQKRIQGGRQL